jgi:TonB-linked SusC/RagA family outer membrane protein
LLSGSIRRDGSSRFGANNLYGVFGAGSVGWIISEESFLKGNKVLSLLKLRGSLGSTGNAEIGNFDSRRLFVSLPYADQSGTAPQAQIGNPDLTWETTVQANIGLEFGFFNGRVSGEVDIYRKNTTGLLLDRQLPYGNGYSVVTENVGELRNQGLEVSLNTRNFDVAGFAWTTNFNISFNRNVITRLPQEIISGGRNLSRVREGEPIGVFWGKRFLGADPTNGDALYEGPDGQPTNSFAAAPNQKIGDPNPQYTGGFTNTFTFKGVDLSILNQFVYGNDIYNAAGVFQSVSADYFDNQTLDQLNRWTTPGQVTAVPQARLYEANGGGASSRWVQDGSFLRFKTVTLGYNLPADIAKRGFLQSARLYVTAQNLFTITNYDGYDPEVNTTSFNATSGTSAGRANYLLGHDFYTPPLPKTFLVGLNLGF